MLANVPSRTMFLDRDWFTLETASTLIANHSGLLHAPLPVQAPPVAAEVAEPVQQEPEQPLKQQQKGKQKQPKQQKRREQSPPPPPPVPLTAIETAASALSGTSSVSIKPQNTPFLCVFLVGLL